jgi:hypothetical protein
MKKTLCILLFFPWVLMAQPKALIFIDSGESEQASLAEAINEMLFYSPTLRSLIDIEIFDINSTGPGFSGGINYARDRGGNMISQYRPPALPFLICINEREEKLRMQLEQKEQLCLCTQGC